MIDVPRPFLWMTAWASSTGAIWFLFDKAEDTIREQSRAALGAWLRKQDAAASVTRWPAHFTAMFDALFTTHHRSMKCFGRSCLASATASFIMLVLWALRRPTIAVASVAQADELSDLLVLSVATPLFTFASFLIDWVSLLETRWVMSRISHYPGVGPTFTLLAFDLVASASIFALGSFIFLAPWNGFSPGAHIALLREAVTLEGFHGFNDLPSLGVPLYSTFFTSVWVWMFAMSFFVVRTLRFLVKPIAPIWRVLDVERKPLRSLGLVSILIMTLLFAIAAVATSNP